MAWCFLIFFINAVYMAMSDFSKLHHRTINVPILYACITLNLNGLKVSAHWVRNFRTLKNKYDLTLCQSHLHTASETFVLQKKFGSGSIFCVFASVACILIGKDGEYEKTGKTHAKILENLALILKEFSPVTPKNTTASKWLFRSDCVSKEFITFLKYKIF